MKNGFLIRAGYVSWAQFPLGHRTDQEILNVSRKLNSKCNVTGFLFRTTKHFIQILEGREKDVMDTMERIRHDSRHFQVNEWTPEKVGNRIYADWDMGYCATTEDDQFAFALSWEKGKPPTESVLKLRAMSETFT